MTALDHPLLSRSNIAKVSAALLIITTTIPDPDDRRAHLIRKIVNSGMDDEEAVEFLALVGMPLDLLEDTRRYLKRGKKKALAYRRQNFFRFANDMFHHHLPEQAVTAVRNGMEIAPLSSDKFVPDMAERSEYLRDQHGIDITCALTVDEILAAKALMALMEAPLDELGGALDYGIIADHDLAVLAIESGDRYPEMIRHIEERRSLDTELLRDLMRSSAPAVSEGIL